MPVIVARVWVITAEVTTLKIAVILPVGTVTEVGTVAAIWLLASLTVTPPEGAGPVRVTVPVAEEPPVRLERFRTTDFRVCGFNVSAACCDEVPIVALIVTICVLVTVDVLMVKVAKDLPEGITTFKGTEARGLLLESLTLTPPV